MNNEKNNKTKTKNHGLFITGVTFVINAIYDFLINSKLGKMVTGADYVNSMISTSYILSLFKRMKSYFRDKFRKQPKKMVGTENFGRTVGIYSENTVGRSFKKQLRRTIESSAIISSLRAFADNLTSLPVISYGIFLLAFGISVTAVQAFRTFTSETPAGSVIGLGYGILILVLSIPALVHKEESAFDCIKGSVIGSFVLYKMMGVSREESKPVLQSAPYSVILFILGTVSGILTLRFSVESVFVALLVLMCAVRVMYVPEFGVILLLLFLPAFTLTPEPVLFTALAIIYICLCFFLNVIVGKRSVNFSFTDFFVSLFVIVAASASFGFPSGEDTALHLLLLIGFTLGYFVVRNLIRSAKWFERALNAFVASAVMTCIHSIIQSIAYGQPTSSVFEDEQTLALFAGVAFIITFVRLIVAKKHSLLLISFLLLEITAVWLSGSRLVLLILTASLVAYLLVCSRKTPLVLLLMLLALPVVSCLITDFDFNEFISLVTFSSPSQADKVEVWRVSSQMARDYMFVGIGLGEDVFRNVYASYSVSGNAVANSMSLFWQLIVQTGIAGLAFFLSACISVTVSVFTVFSKKDADVGYKLVTVGLFFCLVFLLSTGLFVYVWAEPAMFGCFWMILGLAMSALRLAREKMKSQFDYLENVSGDVSLEFVNR